MIWNTFSILLDTHILWYTENVLLVISFNAIVKLPICKMSRRRNSCKKNGLITSWLTVMQWYSRNLESQLKWYFEIMLGGFGQLMTVYHQYLQKLFKFIFKKAFSTRENICLGLSNIIASGYTNIHHRYFQQPFVSTQNVCQIKTWHTQTQYAGDYVLYRCIKVLHVKTLYRHRSGLQTLDFVFVV